MQKTKCVHSFLTSDSSYYNEIHMKLGVEYDILDIINTAVNFFKEQPPQYQGSYVIFVNIIIGWTFSKNKELLQHTQRTPLYTTVNLFKEQTSSTYEKDAVI